MEHFYFETVAAWCWLYIDLLDKMEYYHYVNLIPTLN